MPSTGSLPSSRWTRDNPTLANRRAKIHIAATAQIPDGVLFLTESRSARESWVVPGLELASCECSGNCLDDQRACGCIQVNNRGHAPFHSDGLLEETDRPVFGCGEFCSCHATRCRMRVCQKDVFWALEVFDAGRKGLGVRALQRIPQGSAVVEYVGEDYLVNDPLGVERRYRERGYDRDGLNYVLTFREHFGDQVYVTSVDATRGGNVARFINHSCEDPNLIVVPIRESGPELPPRLMLFAHRDIGYGDELTYRYGSLVGGSSTECLCGSVGGLHFL